jgi:hypothetical protein
VTNSEPTRGTLKIEYRAVTLSRYTVELQEDRRHLKGVSRPHLAEPPFRSDQLTRVLKNSKSLLQRG